MSIHIIITIAILFGGLLALYFASARGVAQVRHGCHPSALYRNIIPGANIILACMVFMTYLEWMPASEHNASVFFLSILSFCMSVVVRMYFIAEGNSSRGKFFVNGLDGLSTSVTCERETMNQALWEAYQLAKKHTNMVFTVTNTRGNQLALVNHSDVSVQMIKSKFGF